MTEPYFNEGGAFPPGPARTGFPRRDRMTQEAEFDFTQVDWYDQWNRENPGYGSHWSRWFMSEKDEQDFDSGRIRGEWVVETKNVVVDSLDGLREFFLPPYIFSQYLGFIPNRYPLPPTVLVQKRKILTIAFDCLEHLIYHFTPTNPIDHYLVVISYQGILQGVAPNEFIRVIPAILIAKTDPMLKARFDQIVMLDVFESGCETKEEYFEQFLDQIDQYAPYPGEDKDEEYEFWLGDPETM